MNLNLATPWGDSCSPPQTPFLSFSSPQSAVMMFENEKDIEIICQSGLRSLKLEWALIICQDKQMWTLAVWMYQANQWCSLDSPWIVMAGFVVVSIPTLLAFTMCQKIIMRGIILPQMK